MAEAVCRRNANDLGLGDDLQIDSAGTGHWHVGEPAHRGTREVLRRNGIRLDHRARQIERRDLEEQDFILAMDRFNAEDIRTLGHPRGKLELLMEYAPELGYAEVPDPYYDGRFDLVYELVNSATARLLDALRQAGRIR
jgi:protein-tyrosine phosphatase